MGSLPPTRRSQFKPDPALMFVYDAVDGDVGKKLRKKNPDPHFLQNHQWLKKFGRDKSPRPDYESGYDYETVRGHERVQAEIQQGIQKGVASTDIRLGHQLVFRCFSYDPGSGLASIFITLMALKGGIEVPHRFLRVGRCVGRCRERPSALATSSIHWNAVDVCYSQQSPVCHAHSFPQAGAEC